MSNTGPSSCGERQTYGKPSRKPGESVQESGAEHEEKPPVQPAAGVDGNQQEDKVEQETPAERIQSIKEFVSGKIKQVIDDPARLEEIAIHMAKYLSGHIKNENDLKVVSDVLFEKCVSEQNIQYTGSRLANHLDKSLNPAGLPEKAFQTVFLKRCQVENEKVGDMIQNNSHKVSNFALFLGELLMNYKTADGSPIIIFSIVLLDIIDKLLGSNDCRHLICAGKLLKLTGSMLDENQEELFQKVKQMASNPNVDRTARDLFTSVGELRSMNWGRDEKLSQSTQPPPPPEASVQASTPYIEDLEGTSLDEQLLNDVSQSTQPPPPEASVQASSPYIEDLAGTSLDEQYDMSPVVTPEQWNEFVVDIEEDSSEKKMEELYKEMNLKQTGVHYPPYATAVNSSSSYPDDGEDDYDAEYEEFLQTIPGNS